MTKNQPATPLPFKTNGVDGRIFGGAATGTIGQINPTANENVAIYDAAYIAHAANAYPKLVSMLRTIGVDTTGYKMMMITRLLRELGEQS